MAKKSYVIDIMQPMFPFGAENIVNKAEPTGMALNRPSINAHIMAIDAANVLPTTTGYSSFFGKAPLNTPDLPIMSERVFTYRDAVGNNTLVALGKYGALLSKDGVTLDNSELSGAIPQSSTGNYKVTIHPEFSYIGFANAEAVITKPAISLTAQLQTFPATPATPAQPNNPMQTIIAVPLDAVGARYQSISMQLPHDEAMVFDKLVEYIDPGLTSITIGSHYCLYTPFSHTSHTAVAGDTVTSVLRALITSYNSKNLVSTVSYESDNRLRNVALPAHSTAFIEPIRCTEVPDVLPAGTLLLTLKNDQIPQQVPLASQGNLGYGIFRSASPITLSHSFNIRRTGMYQVGGLYLPNGATYGNDGGLSGGDITAILDTPFAIPLEYADYMLRQFSGVTDTGLTLEVYDTGIPLTTKPLGSRSLLALQSIASGVIDSNVPGLGVTAVMQTIGQLGSYTQTTASAIGNTVYSAMTAYNAAGAESSSLSGSSNYYTTTAKHPLTVQLSAQPVTTLGAVVTAISASSFMLDNIIINKTHFNKLYNLAFTVPEQAPGLVYTLYNDNEPILITDPNGAWTDANYQFTSAQVAAAIVASTPLVAKLTSKHLSVIVRRADGTYPTIPTIPVRGTSIATATPLVLNQAMYAEIVTAGDSNYFAITPATTGTYVMESSSFLDTYATLHDAAGAVLISNDDGGVRLNFKISYTLTAGVTYYLQARMYSSSKVGAFTVVAGLLGSVSQAVPGTSGSMTIAFHTIATGLGSNPGYHVLDNGALAKPAGVIKADIYTKSPGMTGFLKQPESPAARYTELDTPTLAIPVNNQVTPQVIDKHEFIVPVDDIGHYSFGIKDLDVLYEDYKVNIVVEPLGVSYPFPLGYSRATPNGEAVRIIGTVPHNTTQRAALELINPWTIAVIKNSLYCYRQGLGYILHFLAATSTWERLTPTFVNLPQIQGISTARGRLMMWDSANAVYTSSVNNPMEFTPSVSTKANVTKIDALIGDIITTLPLKDGYIIYASSSIISATYIGGTVNYKYTVLSQSQGILNPNAVTVANEVSHFAYTNVGLVKVTAQGLTPVSYQADSYIRQTNLSPRLDFLSGKYLAISFAPQQSAQKVYKVEAYKGAVIKGIAAIPGTADKFIPEVIVPAVSIPVLAGASSITIPPITIPPLVVTNPNVVPPGISSNPHTNANGDVVIPPITIPGFSVPDIIIPPIPGYRELAFKGNPATNNLSWDLYYNEANPYIIPGYTAHWTEYGTGFGTSLYAGFDFNTILRQGVYVRPDFVIANEQDVIAYHKWLLAQPFHPSNVVGNAAYFYFLYIGGTMGSSPKTILSTYKADGTFVPNTQRAIQTDSVILNAAPTQVLTTPRVMHMVGSPYLQSGKLRIVLRAEVKIWVIAELIRIKAVSMFTISRQDMPTRFVGGLSPSISAAVRVWLDLKLPPALDKSLYGVGGPPQHAATPDIFTTVSDTAGSIIPGYTIPDVVIPGYTIPMAAGNGSSTIPGINITGQARLTGYTIPGYTIPGVPAVTGYTIPSYTMPSYTVSGQPAAAVIPDLVIPGGSYIAASGSSQTFAPEYTRSLLFDTQLVNWGSYDEVHSMLWDFSPINLRSYNPVTGVSRTKFDTQNMSLDIGILDTLGKLSQAITKNPLARLEFGDIGYTRTGVTRMLGAEAHFTRETGAFLEIQGSLNGELLSRVLRAAEVSQAGSIILNTVLTGKWFRIIIHGTFDIKSLTFHGEAGGKR